MSDWLTDLREEKQKAIAQSKEHSVSVAAAKTELEKQQGEILTMLSELQVEPLLLQLQNDILVDHPFIFDASIKREVKSRADAVAGEIVEPTPLSGSLDKQSIGISAGLSDGRYISEVNWRLRLNFKDLEGNPARPKEIVVAITPSGASVGDRELGDLMRDEFQSALVAAFRDASNRSRSGDSLGRRHKRRAWHRRLLQAAFPVSAMQQRWAIAILFLIVILAVAFGLYARQIIDILLRRVAF